MGQSRVDLADAAVAATCLSPVAGGAPFPCAVTVLGLGDAVPPPLLIELRLPPGMLHVGHDAAGRFDADARTLTFRLAPATGAPRAFHLELIADPAAAGTVSSLPITLRVDGLHEHAERHTSASVAIERQSRVDLGYAVLPVAPWIVFGAMLLTLPLGLGLVRLLRRGRRALARRPRRPGYPPVPRDTVMAPVFLSLVCVLALALTSPALVESVRSLTVFAETRCTVLDRALSGSPHPDADLVPTAVVRHATPAGPRVAVGFDVRGTLVSNGNAAAHEALTVGRVYPCWIDPQRPERVVLRRGVSGGALLALIPAVALLGLLPAVRRAWRS